MIGCMNNRSGTCRLDERPCEGGCGQRVSFDKDLNDDVRAELPKNRKFRAAPLLTEYEFMMSQSSTRDAMRFTTNRTLAQRKLGIGTGTMKWEGRHDTSNKNWFGREAD